MRDEECFTIFNKKNPTKLLGRVRLHGPMRMGLLSFKLETNAPLLSTNLFRVKEVGWISSFF